MSSVESALKDCFIDASASLVKALANRGITANVEEKDPVLAFQNVASLVVKHSELFDEPQLLKSKFSFNFSEVQPLSACSCVMQAAFCVETAAFFVKVAAKDNEATAKINKRLLQAFVDEYRSVLPAGTNDYELFMSLCPATVLLDRALSALGDKKQMQAISLLTWAAAECSIPLDPILYVRAQAYFDFGYDSNALDDLMTAIYYNKHMPRYFLLMSRILIHRKQYPAALSQCERALAIDHNDSEANALRRKCFQLLSISLDEIEEEKNDQSHPPRYAEDEDDGLDSFDLAALTNIPKLFMNDIPKPLVLTALKTLRDAARNSSCPKETAGRIGYAVALFLLSGNQMAPSITDEEKKELFDLIKTAGDCGMPEAREFCARMLCHGIGCERNFNEAVKMVGAKKDSGEEKMLASIHSASIKLQHWEENRRLGDDGLSISERIGRMDVGHVPVARIEQLSRLADSFKHDKETGATSASNVDETTRSALEGIPRMIELYSNGSKCAGDALTALYLAFDACNNASRGRVVEGYALMRLARRVCDSIQLPIGPLCAAFDDTMKKHKDNADLMFFRLVFSAQMGAPEKEALAKEAVDEFPHDADFRYLHGTFLSMIGKHERALKQAERAVHMDPSVPFYQFALPAIRQQEAFTDAQVMTCVKEFEEYLSMVPADDRRVPDAHFNIARLLLGLKEPTAETVSKAKQHYLLGVESSQPDKRLFFYPTIAPAPALKRIIDSLPDDVKH